MNPWERIPCSQHPHFNCSRPVRIDPNDSNIRSSLSLGAIDTETGSSRFSSQTRDCFVVRVVKVTDRRALQSSGNAVTSKGYSSPNDLERQTLLDPQNLLVAQRTIIEAVRNNNPAVSIKFRAQLPAVAVECGYKSISTDQLNHSYGIQIQQLNRVGRGVRLAFSCSLMGSGLRIEDLGQGPIAPILRRWERSSRRSGFLEEVLKALKISVDQILTHLRTNGFANIQAEKDYTFYPFTPHLYFNPDINVALYTPANSPTKIQPNTTDPSLSIPIGVEKIAVPQAFTNSTETDISSIAGFTTSNYIQLSTLKNADQAYYQASFLINAQEVQTIFKSLFNTTGKPPVQMPRLISNEQWSHQFQIPTHYQNYP